MADTDIKSLGSFVWSIAELLRGDLKQSEYGKVVLPFVVLRRLDCILAPTKDAVVSLAEELPDDLEEEERSLSEIIDSFNERHGTTFSPEDFLFGEQANRELLDGDMMEMLLNNPANVVYGAFSQAFMRQMIRQFQKSSQMRSIVMSDTKAREQLTKHFFQRAQRVAREARN